MRLTALKRNQYTGANVRLSAASGASSASVPPPVGGWNTDLPLADMPPEFAVELVNWWPEPTFVSLRRGHVYHCDLGTGEPVETVMGYQSEIEADNSLLAASDGEIFTCTTSTPTSVGSGFASDRWQFTNFGTSGGSFLWMCNGFDTPQYWDGATLTATVITGVTAEDMIHVVQYRSRLWTVLKNSTKAAYLDVDSIQGAATVFDVGSYFSNGGYLQAIGTWSTDANDGPNEYIVFISSFGDVALFQIEDPDDATKVFFRGTASIGSPIGRRCTCDLGSDLAVVTVEGVLPLSQVLTYDKAALIRASITKNIRQAMTEAAQRQSEFFGWQLISYPRSTMAILNVPVVENSVQNQFVMNTLNGAWARFEGQNGSCWEVFENRAYFGGNDGIVRLADEAGADEDQTLSANMVCAWNYYGPRGREKRWTMARPLITVSDSFTTQPYFGMNVDYQDTAILEPITFSAGNPVPLWNSAIWDQAVWPGESTQGDWVGVAGLGYCSSIRMTCDVPWSEDQRPDRALKINSFDVLLSAGGFI